MTYPTVPLQIPIFMIGIQFLNSPLINKLLNRINLPIRKLFALYVTDCFTPCMLSGRPKVKSIGRLLD